MVEARFVFEGQTTGAIGSKGFLASELSTIEDRFKAMPAR
jgi:hypothetical protein